MARPSSVRRFDWEGSVATSDYRAMDHRRDAQCDRGAVDHSWDETRLVLVEPKALWRDWIDYILTTFVPDSTVECVSEADEIIGGKASLLVVGLDPRSLPSPLDLRASFAAMRRLCDGAPIAVILHSDDAALATELGSLDVAGILQPALGMEIAIAALRLILVGGTFLPLEAFRHNGAPDSRHIGTEATSAILPTMPCCVEPAPHNEAASELRANDNLSSGDVELTSREHDVLKLLRAGRQNKIIAYELGISESTVKVHLRNIMKKLHVSNRTQVAVHINVALPHFETPLRPAGLPLS
jgi:DNA-binding NarL/FixJ family response regulator